MIHSAADTIPRTLKESATIDADGYVPLVVAGLTTHGGLV